MHTVTRRSEHLQEGGRTALFEGKGFGSGVTFFWVDNAPGEGPPLHRHPYSETWAVISGSAVVTADGEVVEVSEGDIMVIGPGTPHKFQATGTERLHMVCMHDSPHLVEEELDDYDVPLAP